jgi:hypothetical protein
MSSSNAVRMKNINKLLQKILCYSDLKEVLNFRSLALNFSAVGIKTSWRENECLCFLYPWRYCSRLSYIILLKHVPFPLHHVQVEAYCGFFGRVYQVRTRKHVYSCMVFISYPEEKITRSILRIRFKDNIEMNLKLLGMG